jgi:hypothetical protein
MQNIYINMSTHDITAACMHSLKYDMAISLKGDIIFLAWRASQSNPLNHSWSLQFWNPSGPVPILSLGMGVSSFETKSTSAVGTSFGYGSSWPFLKDIMFEKTSISEEFVPSLLVPKGIFPVTISKIITPNAHQSDS